jgi:LAO/AO transport system kinase
MLAEKAWHLIQNKRMKEVSKLQLKEEIEQQIKSDLQFNLYRFIKNIS